MFASICRSYSVVTIEWNNETTEVCHIGIADWVDEYIGADLYYSSYYLFRILFVHLIPCFLLVILNVLLFKAMKQAQDKRKKLCRENRKKECKKLRDANCTTLMLIVVVSRLYASLKKKQDTIFSIHLTFFTSIFRKQTNK